MVTVSEIWFIIIMTGGMVTFKHTVQELLRVLYITGNKKLAETLGGILSIGNLKADPHIDILPPARSHPFSKTTPSNSVIPYRDYVGQLFKLPQWPCSFGVLHALTPTVFPLSPR